MTTTAMTFNNFVIPNFDLPWESTRKEDERFKRILKRLLLLLLLLAIVFPWLPLPQIEREDAEKIPPALAKIIIEQEQPTHTPPARPKPVREEKTAEKVPSKVKHNQSKQAAKKVASIGVAAFSNQLQSLRNSLDVAKLQARNTNIETGKAEKSTRSVLGRKSVTRTSGGTSSAVMSTDVAKTELADRSGVLVATSTGDGDGTGGGTGNGVSHSTGSSKYGSSETGMRDMESIRRVFEQHKGAIYAIYNRALRRDPEIRGKYVFHIMIEPNGRISKIQLVSSELGNSLLEKKLLARIRIIDFGPEDVAETPVNYRFDFLPS